MSETQELYPNANHEIVKSLQAWAELARSGELQAIAIAGRVKGEPMTEISAVDNDDAAMLFFCTSEIQAELSEVLWEDEDGEE